MHRPDRRLDDFLVEPRLAAEVVVHGRDVGASGLTDLADGDLREAALREQPCRAVDQPLSSLAFALVHF